MGKVTSETSDRKSLTGRSLDCHATHAMYCYRQIHRGGIYSCGRGREHGKERE